MNSLLPEFDRLQKIIETLDNRVTVFLVYDPLDGEILHSRTTFDHPDPLKRPRQQCWTVDKLAQNYAGNDLVQDLAEIVISYWDGRRLAVEGRKDVVASMCDCKLVAGHETWCHKWEAY